MQQPCTLHNVLCVTNYPCMPKPYREFHLLMIDSSATGKHLHPFMTYAANGWMNQLPTISEQPDITDVYFSIYTFNSEGFQCLANNLHADLAKPIHPKQFQAAGRTSIFDGSLPCFDHFMQHVNWPSHHVFCDILITGFDHSSRIHKSPDYARLIENGKQRGWLFSLLGVDINPQPLADELGFDAHLHLECADPSKREWLEIGKESLN